MTYELEKCEKRKKGMERDEEREGGRAMSSTHHSINFEEWQ